MKLSTLVTGGVLLQAAATVHAAPQLIFNDAADHNQVAFGNAFQSATLSWAHRAADKISQLFGFASTENAFDQWLNSPYDASNEDKTVWEIINESDEFRQLAHVLNYSSDSTKELLQSKDKQLTFFAPINWHHTRPDETDRLGDWPGAEAETHAFDQELGPASVQRWNQLERQIVSFEQEFSAVKDDDSDKRRRRAIIRHLIDAEAYYHLVRSDDLIDAKTLAANSSVATHLNTGSSHAYNDGTDWRIRVGKSLLPLPAIYLNFYSRVVKPDIKAQNGLIHGIKYPLILPPDVLQSLFFGQSTFSTSTSALQKVNAAQYLAYRPYRHGHHGDHGDHGHHGDHGKHGEDVSAAGCSNSSFIGVPAETVFVPTNLAWLRLPFIFRAYLFSPWGYHLLQKVFMLHSLPSDIVYADFVHHVKRGKGKGVVEPREVTVSSSANKTSYTFDTVLPSLKGEKGKFEQVDVDVYRYNLLPGGKGPLQTRVVVQNVSVILQDIPASNGVYHAIDKFIKPKGHPEKGLWAEIASAAEAAGFGSVDLAAEASAALW